MDTNSFALGILIALSACLANVSSQRERCLGNYCSGSFGDMKAICKDGYCYCTGQDYDYNTCLPDAYGCRIEVHSNASPAIPRYNNQQPSTVYSCTPGSSSSQYEVHVMSVYEGNRHTRPPSAGDTAVNIVSSNKSGRPIILVFGSYEPVNWILNLPANITISKVILVAYYIAQSSVRGDMNQVQAVERKTWQWGMGYGSDTGGGDTVALLRQVHSLFGVVTSFTGTYKADHWSLTLSSQGTNSLIMGGPPRCHSIVQEK